MEAAVPTGATDGSTVSTVAYAFGALHAVTVPGPLLIRLLVDLGVNPGTARTTLSRMASAGQIRSTRHGRIVVYTLIGAFLQRFLRLGLGEAASTWAGAFDAVLYEIGEHRRPERDELRNRAFAAGFNAPRPGVLIGFTDPSPWVPELPRGEGFVAITRLECDLATARQLVLRAWRTTDLIALIDRQHDRIRGVRAAADRDPLTALQAHCTATNALAAAVLRAPNLPVELQPPGWHADQLVRDHETLSARLWPLAERHLTAATNQSGVQHLLVPLPR